MSYPLNKRLDINVGVNKYWRKKPDKILCEKEEIRKRGIEESGKPSKPDFSDMHRGPLRRKMLSQDITNEERIHE